MKRRAYSEHDMQNALSAYRKGEYTSIRDAARAFNIPFTTLRERLAGRTTRHVAHESAQILSNAEERSLAKLITRLTITGFPASPALVVQMAELVLSKRVVLSRTNPSPVLPTQRIGEN